MHFSRVIILPIAFSAALAEAEPDKLLVGVDAWHPFRFIDNNGVTGIDHELWQQLEGKLNFTVEYIQCPWKRCLEMMKSGQIDAMSGLAWRASRAEYIQYINDAYFKCSTRFYLRKGNEKILKTAEDLNNLNIGMVRGSAYYPDFDDNTSLNKTQMTQESVLLQLLSAHRIDTYIGTDCQADYELAHSRYSKEFIKAPFNPANHTPLYIGFSKQSDWAEKSDRFNQAVNEALDSGFIDQINAKYYGQTNQ